MRRGAPLEDMEAFDAAFFGMSPHEAAVMDPQHRHFLECAWEALEHAGHVPSRFAGPIGVFAGSGHNAYLGYNLLTHPELLESDGFFLLRHTGNDKDFLTTRVSYVLDLRGPSVNVQTACSTSLVAVHYAVQSLLAGECDMALAGGVTIELPHRRGYVYAEGEILSPDGTCRAFDAQAAGTVFGSGAGAVVLRRLEDAVADGDTIYAVVKGTAINNDGSKKVSYLAPSVEGQAAAIAEALAVSGVDASTIGYVAAHGTGTPVGDPIEVAALTEAFRRHTDKRGYCTIGSVKTNIGHTDTAAGIASLIAAIQAIRHRQLPPTLHFTAPNPACQFEETPFRPSGRLEPWLAEGPRRAGVSSLGVGGTNAHVIVEEAPAQPPSPGGARELLVLSARTPEALERATDRLAAVLTAPEAPPLADAAWTLQVGREAMAHRRMVVAHDAADAGRALAARDPLRVFTAAAPERERSVAFMFAGGGAQHVGMGGELYREEPAYRAAADEALAALGPARAAELCALLCATPDEANARVLERPSLGLPALFATQYALARLLETRGVRPTALIGHSMGEYTAACLAGVFPVRDAMRLVAKRAELFETVEEGAMLSVPLPEAELRPLLGATLSVAAVNGPSLSVASGPVDAIERLARELGARGVETSRLRISVAAHSALLEPILDAFRGFVRGLALSAPKIPVASNLSGTWLTDAEATDPDYWVRHLRRTVRFADGVRTLVGDGARALLEVGPGRTLATLARQQGGTAPVAIASMRHPTEALGDGDALLLALGRLWAAGVPLEWAEVRAGRAPGRRVALPTYPFARERHWIEPRAGSAAAGGALAGDLHRTADLGDWFMQPSWRRAAPALVTPIEGPVLFFSDRSPVARALYDRLRGASIDVATVRRGRGFQQHGTDAWSVAPGSADDAVKLFAALRDAGRLPRHVVFAWPLEEGTPEEAFHALLALAQALGGEEVTTDLLVLTAGAHRVASETSLAPGMALLTGAVRVVPAELPGVRARLVDLPGDGRQWSARLVEQLAIELAAVEPDVVALRGPDRWMPALEPLRLDAPPAAPFRERGVYLVTGGFGGLGLSIARHLAATQAARLVLVGRHPLPPRLEWTEWLERHGSDDETSRRLQLVQELEAHGADVLALSADVADARAMRQVVEEARRRFGALHGVFHTAGVLDDGALQMRAAEQAGRVLAPKVAGTLALHAALRDVTPDFVVLFSSISAFAGLPGQFDYAAANAFLDAWAQAQAAAGGTRVAAIDWAPWADVGMAASLAGSLGVTRAPEGEATGHPVLRRRRALSQREIAFLGTVSPETDWMLAEHRVRGGAPLLPGTGFLALMQVADTLAGREGGTALRDVEFVDALVVPEGERRDIRVRVDSVDGQVAFESRRDAGSPWRLHARARLGASGSQPTPVDVESLMARCPHPVDGASISTEAPHLAFGPRWHNVRRIGTGQREAFLELELDPRFADDLKAFPLHPALLDLGYAGAQAVVPWLDRATQLLVPLAVGTLRVHAPLEARIVSRARYREDLSTPGDVAVFDVALCDPAGRVLVEVSEFSMLAVRDRTRLAAPAPRQVAAPAGPPANPLLSLTLREGIREREGIEALERILAAGPPPQVTVSPLPLEPLLAQLRAGTRARAVVARPAGAAADAATPATQVAMTPLQRDIATLVGGMLSAPAIGLDENLIDLGLHSLLAVRLFNRLKKMTGQNLPLATLLEAPTIRTLSERFGDRPLAAEGAAPRIATPLPQPGGDLLASSDAVRDPRAHEHWLRPLWSHVVPLKPSGSLPPFFCIHARGGAVLNYRTLASFVEPEQPVYGIQCRGLDGRTDPFRSIEEMAQQYIEEVRRIQPQGPYFLGGGSLGGIVALEMAQRLAAEGERIGLLTMFDSWGPTWFSPGHQPAVHARLARRLASHFQRLQREGVAGEASLLMRRAWWRLQARGKKVACAVLRMMGAELPHSLRYFYVEQANLAALWRYVPAEYQGRVVLFRALDDSDADFSDPTMGWHATVRGSVEVIDSPGTHNSMVHDPMFGELFRNRLQQAQQEAAAERPVEEPSLGARPVLSA
ncbi:MAG TPA: SDR family NAD(P)-dependent oxidoreductase [Gemmatimonadales bacterium]|nr:SDR family NAD(P)-dependent oxidoreductase [Gemmatimonadales bacterium]